MLNFNPDNNEEELCLNLDLVKEKRELDTIREARYKQCLKVFYAKRVRNTQFQVVDVLIRNEAKKTLQEGKMEPAWEGPYRIEAICGPGAYKLSYLNGKSIP